ncbi:putative Omega-amidase YafV [Pillotina sp. SPG140]|jgi:predicted amidohydrolase
MFKVAMLQLISLSTQHENLDKGIEYCKMSKEMGADLALFPEMWNVGYTFSPNINEMKEKAIDRDSPFVHTFKHIAKELNMAIAVTYLEKWDLLPRNTVTIIDRFGKCIVTYAKVHTCDFGKERNLTPGDDFYVADLNTSAGNIKIGTMICYDREFPESARILMLKGAEILLVPKLVRWKLIV